MKYFPLGLDLRGRTCIVVGGGTIGTRKVRSLLEAGAAVTLVSPAGTEEVTRLAETDRIRWRDGEYEESDLNGAFLVVAATDDITLNERVVEDAKRRGVLICDASSAHRSELIFGALHRQGEVTVAVFTDGQDPSLSRKTRDRIAALGEEWGEE